MLYHKRRQTWLHTSRQAARGHSSLIIWLMALMMVGIFSACNQSPPSEETGLDDPELAGQHITESKTYALKGENPPTASGNITFGKLTDRHTLVQVEVKGAPPARTYRVWIQDKASNAIINSFYLNRNTTSGAKVITTNQSNGKPLPYEDIFKLNAYAVVRSSDGRTVVRGDIGAIDHGPGNLQINVTGLPAGVAAKVNVAGPHSFSRDITATTIMNNLPHGDWVVTASNVVSGSTYYATVSGSPAHVGGGTTTTVSVVYSFNPNPNPTKGSLQVNISGLPQGASAKVKVTGPNNFSKDLSSNTTLSDLNHGEYAVSASSVVAGATYVASVSGSPVHVLPGTPATVSVVYSVNPNPNPSRGNLQVNIGGLPQGTNANVRVMGPGGFSRDLSANTTLSDLNVGSYTILASNVTAGGTTYTPSPASSSVNVTAGATATATVGYSASTPIPGAVPGGPNTFTQPAPPALDRCHSSPNYTLKGPNPILSEPLTTTFLSNVPLNVRVEDRGGAWWGDRVLIFTNRSTQQFHIDCAVIIFRAPSGSGNAHSYWNSVSPFGHPQQDFVEVPKGDGTSFYIIRLGFHDVPLSQRIAYPGKAFEYRLGIPKDPNKPLLPVETTRDSIRFYAELDNLKNDALVVKYGTHREAN